MQAENIRRVPVSSDHAPQAVREQKSGSPKIGSRSKVDLGGNATKLLKTVLRSGAEGMVNVLTKNLHHDDFSSRQVLRKRKAAQPTMQRAA